MRIRVSEIERSEQARQVLAVDESVQGPPPAVIGLGQIHRGGIQAAITRGDGDDHRRPAEGAVELPRYGQQRVPQRLELQPAAVHPPEQEVVGVDVGVGGVVVARLLVYGGLHDQPVQVFDGPTVFHEVIGQVVQHGGMRGRGRADAEIARSGYQRAVEMVHPDAVDHHARGQRIILAGDGLGQLQAAAALFKGLPLSIGKHPKEPPRHLLAPPVGVAPLEDHRLHRLLTIHQDHGPHRRARMGNLDGVQLADEDFQRPTIRAVEQPVPLLPGNVERGIRSIEHLPHRLQVRVVQRSGRRLTADDGLPGRLRLGEQRLVPLGDFLQRGWRLL